MDASSLLPILTVVILFGVGFFLGVMRNRQGDGRSGPPDPEGMASFIPSGPISPSFEVTGWDGFSGTQFALAVGLSDDECYPLMEAGTQPPASVTSTFSTASADQEVITLRLFACLDVDTSKAQRFGTVTVGPIAVTGEAIRSVEVSFAVAEDGTVSFAASDEGGQVAVEVVEQYLGALPVGA